MKPTSLILLASLSGFLHASCTNTFDDASIESRTQNAFAEVPGSKKSDSDSSSDGSEPLNLPLASWSNFRYAGGFRLPADKQSIDGIEFRYRGNRGSIGISQDRGKMFVGAYLSGDGNDKPGWAQIDIPTLNPGDAYSDMPIAISIQGMAQVWHDVLKPDGRKNRSLHCIEYDGMLIGTMVYNYDATRSQSHFLWRVEDATDLASSRVGGLYELEGAYHAAGWIVEIPDQWQALVGYEHLMGNAHNFSISGRASIGPTFFGIDLSQVTRSHTPERIRTEVFMNYPRSRDKGLFATKYPEKIQDISGNWLTTDRITYRDMHYNIRVKPHPTQFPPSHVDFPDQDTEILGNDIWTATTRAGIGFIIPGTRTYAVFGKSAGMKHGLGYRIKDNVGREMSGPAPYVNNDRYNFHWFFDMQDILDVKNGLKEPWDILPYSYGPIELPYERPPRGSAVGDSGYIFGGTFDPDNMRVYFAIRGYDRSKPLILAYDIDF